MAVLYKDKSLKNDFYHNPKLLKFLKEQGCNLAWTQNSKEFHEWMGAQPSKIHDQILKIPSKCP